MQAIRSFSVDAVPIDNVQLPKLIPARGTGLRRHLCRIKAPRHIPDDVMVNEVYALPGALDKNRFPLLNAVQEQVSGNPVVLVSAVQPEMIRPEGVPENVVPDQAVHAVVQLDGPRFPAQLHLLPAGAVNDVALNQHPLREHPGNAADARVLDGAVPDHAVSDDLVRPVGMMPALVAHINGHTVGPVNRAALDDPVMSPVGGNRPALRYRRAGGRMLADQVFDPDIVQKRLVRREALFPHRHLNPVILRILIILQAEVNLLAVGLHPVCIVLLRHAAVQRHLLQRLAVTKDAATPVQVSGHIRLVILNEQPVMQDVHRAEGVVAPEQIRIQVIFPDADSLRLFRSPDPVQHPTLAGNEVFHFLRGADDHVAVAESLIGDHMLRIRTAPGRLHAFPVQARMDPHPGTRRRFRRRPADRPERMSLAAVIIIRSSRI